MVLVNSAIYVEIQKSNENKTIFNFFPFSYAGSVLNYIQMQVKPKMELMMLLVLVHLGGSETRWVSFRSSLLSYKRGQHGSLLL